LVALGALTVGLQEAYKKLFATLARFHRKAVLRWLLEEEQGQAGMNQVSTSASFGGHYGVHHDERAAQATDSSTYEGRRAYAELLHLTTGVGRVTDNDTARNSRGEGSEDLLAKPFKRSISFALFELELAKMMSQIQDAADAALNNPYLYPQWFSFLTRGCSRKDVDKWVDTISAARVSSVSDAQSPDFKRSKEEAAETYSRIRLLMRRQLDSFQTVTAYRWKEWNQLWAWAVGGLLLLFAQLYSADLAGKGPADLLWMAFASLAGGILAPIAKDLVDTLARVKSGG
jgi:hypothetical protein